MGSLSNSTHQNQQPCLASVDEEALIIVWLFVAAAEAETVTLLQDQKLAE